MVNATGCTTANTNSDTTANATYDAEAKKKALEYNAKYLQDNLNMDEFSAQYISQELQNRGFGKIVSNTKVMVNGNGSLKIGDLIHKYTINFADGYLTNITDEDDNVILTLDDIVNAYANGIGTTSTTPSSDEVTGNEQTNNTTSSSSSTNSYISEEAQELLETIESDYSKVNWGVEYSPTGMDGIVISIAPYNDNGSNYLAIAVTNLYNTDTTFSAEGYAKGTSGQKVGNVLFYDTAIRPGNTIIKLLYCDDVPTGEEDFRQV